MAINIHPTAVVAKGAQIDDEVTIGAYAMIGEKVKIGLGCEIMSHAVVTGETTLGKYNRIFHHAAIGEGPQDKNFHDEPAQLIIGDHNIIREFCTIHTGAVAQGAPTRIGNHNFFMTYSHIGHNCFFHNHIVLVNNVQVAGHVEVFDHVMIGACSGVHQFCRIGAQSMVAAYSTVLKDVPPFLIVAGQPCRAYGLNRVGLRRRGYSKERIEIIRDNFRLMYQRGHDLQTLHTLLAKKNDEDSSHLHAFLTAPSKRGFIRTPPRHHAHSAISDDSDANH